MKLISITESTKPDKKLMAIFDNDGRKKTVHFGAKGMDDYTLTKSKEQREHYRTRHKKDLETGDPSRAGFLSYYILWGDSTSRKTNISEYKKKFNL
jgi:protein required for attachment to host cells